MTCESCDNISLVLAVIYVILWDRKHFLFHCAFVLLISWLEKHGDCAGKCY